MGLCHACRSIKLDILDHLDRIKTRYGTLIARLPPLKTWSDATCPLCRLLKSLVSMQRRDVLDQEYQRYVLRAFSSRRSYDLGYPCFTKTRLPDFGLLGVIPRDAITDPSDRDFFLPGRVAFLASHRSLKQRSSPGFRLRIVEPKVNFDLVRRWVEICKECHGDHSNSRGPRELNDFNFLRVIDCKTGRIEPASADCDYVALSYVWGKGPSSHLDDNEICEGVLPALLPAVVRDAMEVVKQISFRFLWVDRYCIHQNDECDKHNQISKMDMVYRNAQLVIIAGAGSDPEYGLPGVGKKVRAPSPSASIAGHHLHVVPPDPNQRLEESTWMTRAWVYQEAVFSRRRLVFTDDQVYFDCDSMTCRELIDTNPELLQSKRRARNVFRTSIFPMLNPPFFASGSPDYFFTQQNIKLHVKNYSSRQLTDALDVLRGILGIFRAYEVALVDEEFKQYWGIPLFPYRRVHQPPGAENHAKWTTRLPAGFSWYLVRPCPRRTGFPSWSWTGWLGKISFLMNLQGWSPDLSVVIRVECQDGGRMWLKPFEEFMPHRTSMRFATPRLRVEAWTVQLRFEYLADGLPLNWNPDIFGPQGPCFCVRTNVLGNQPRPLRTPLYLDAKSDSTSRLFERLCEETWECIVVGYSTMPSGAPQVLVCEWEGQIARRIGIVSLSVRSLEFLEYDHHPDKSMGPSPEQEVPFRKTWRRDILLE